jgi:hypothetical protein
MRPKVGLLAAIFLNSPRLCPARPRSNNDTLAAVERSLFRGSDQNIAPP